MKVQEILEWFSKKDAQFQKFDNDIIDVYNLSRTNFMDLCEKIDGIDTDPINMTAWFRDLQHRNDELIKKMDEIIATFNSINSRLYNLEKKDKKKPARRSK